MALALDAAWFQQILHQLEYGDDMAALLGMVLVRRKKLGQHQDDRGEQTFGGIVEEGVLSTIAFIAVRVDDGLGQDLGVFFCLGTSCQIPRFFTGDVHVSVDQRQQIITIRAGGVSQVDNGNIVPIALLGNGSVIAGEVAFAVQRQPAHAAGTGIFQVGIQKESGLANTGRTDHETMDIVAVHQSGEFPLFSFAPQHQPLLCGAVVAAAPLLDLEGDVGIGPLDLLCGGPPCGTMLSVAHCPGLDAAQGVAMGQGRKASNDKKHSSAGQNQERRF